MSTADAAFKRTQQFEFFTRRIWPMIRKFFSGSLTPRCVRCSISAKAPEVKIVGGICNTCKDYDSRTKSEDHDKIDHETQSRELDGLLKEHQGSGRGRYDAVLVFSGGKDSTYLLYRLKRDYPGLRVLAATWDNGFYSPIALQTAQDVARKLDVEHVLFKPMSRVYGDMYRYSLTHVGEGGCYLAVDGLDGTLNQHMGMTLAAQMDIPLFITGIERAQALVMAGYTHFEMPKDRLQGRADQEFVESRSEIKLADVFTEDDLKLWWDGDRWEVHPRVLIPFIAWRPEHSVIVSELKRNDLVMPSHLSPLLTNNEVLPIMAAVDIVKIGYCSFEPEFSEMVRGGEGDPLFWRNVFEFLEFSVRKGWFLRGPYLHTLERLGLSPKDIGLG